MAPALAALALGCQGDYPLEPTACDHWCRVTQRPGCTTQDPAECVAACEEFEDAPSDPPCDAVFEKLVNCLEQVPDALYCKCLLPYISSAEAEPCPCVVEGNDLADCQLFHSSGGGTSR